MASKSSRSFSGDAQANKNMEEGETSSKVSLPALSSTISRIKKQVNLERQAYVKAKTEANSEKLQHFCAHLLDLSSSRARKNNTQSEKDMLNFRIQKALNKFGADASSADQEGTSVQDDSSAPIVVGSTAGSKNVVKPVRLQTVQRTPPYTTWIFLDRNQRMAEDQSVVGRRRIYYDSAGNEALICSDSEEEQVEEEEDKRDFSKGDDFVIRTTVQEHGISKAVWKALADCLDAKVNEIEARYELLLKEAERKGGDPYEKKAFNNGQDLDGTKLEDDIFQAKDLSSAMDSFDKLFCRRCLVFDCRLHGCSQLVVIPSEKQPPLNKTGELASFPCGPCCFHLPRLSSPDQGCSLVGNVRSMALQPAFSATADSLESISQIGAEKGSTRNQKQEDTDKAVTGAGTVADVSATKPAEKSLLQPPEFSKKGIKDKRVNALRKLLKRKAGRGTDDDSHEARKKHQTEAPHSEAEEGAGISKGEAENTCPDSNVFSEKVVSKKFYNQKKMKKGIQITKVKRALAPTKEGGDYGKLENVQNLDSLGKDLAVGDSNWNPLEKELYQKGLQIFGRDSCLIAKNLLKGLKSCAEVGEFMQLEAAANWRLGEETKLQQDGSGKTQLGDSLDIEVSRSRLYNGRRRGRVRRLKYTWKSVPAIRKRLVDGKEGCRQYTPCSCLYTCGKQCPCLRNGTYCEKYCGCSKGCKNRFRGCHCAKSQCCSRQCPCFAAGRECDPDVCRNCWVGCGDGTQGGPPSQGATYLCRNMKLLLKQQQRVLLGRSDVAGWGAFLKSPVSKHEYLGEYTGELISHREADKRGKIYDRENSSFLFNLNDQYVLDACRKGDKLKFANHSPNPNCYAKVIMVAGDHRVGIFAKERVAAGEELFYDYRYEADRAPPWARKPEDGHKHDEFASGSGRAQKTA